MSANRRKYDADFRKNAVKLSYVSPKTVKEIADDLGVSESMLYRWRQRYTAQGEKTQTATLEEENRALRLECAELKIERDMLKKAAAYFAKLQK
jgi:transposase